MLDTNTVKPMRIVSFPADEQINFYDFTDESTVSLNSAIIDAIMEDEVPHDVKSVVDELVLRVSNALDGTNKKLTRKRQINKKNWSCHKRKVAHQAGE